MIRVGLIGAGSIAEYHARALAKAPGIEVAAVCDVNLVRAQAFATTYGIPVAVGSIEELLSMGTIDAVTIGIWNAAHASVAIQALDAGKHVFCEKPMARNAIEAQSMVAAESNSGKLLMIGLVRRYELRTEIARDIVRRGELGNVYYARAGYLRRDGQPGGWFTSREHAGGGALLDIGIHSLDLALHLADLGTVERVSGFTRQLPSIMDAIIGTEKYVSKDSAGERDVEDHAFATLTFRDGGLLTIEASWAQHRERDTQYLELYGERGGLVVDPALHLSRNAGNALSDTTFPLVEPGDRLQEMFDREMAHFAACLNDGVRCMSPSADGLELMRIIDAIYRSASEGREVRLAE
ncbi:MAG TPA: Gfo/Idh/MocA family oxidoreductase [Spirochaetia bacterium]|nr:Gfo/Idh/MocA family oxidoreductase [Spirochaetia bacterium]